MKGVCSRSCMDFGTPFLFKSTPFINVKGMTSELIIDVQQKEISIALLEDKSLVEYQSESKAASFSVGNIYVAKVKKLMPGLNASRS